jgi:hypothetical protein
MQLRHAFEKLTLSRALLIGVSAAVLLGPIVAAGSDGARALAGKLLRRVRP